MKLRETEQKPMKEEGEAVGEFEFESFHIMDNRFKTSDIVKK